MIIGKNVYSIFVRMILKYSIIALLSGNSIVWQQSESHFSVRGFIAAHFFICAESIAPKERTKNYESKKSNKYAVIIGDDSYDSGSAHGKRGSGEYF